MLTLHLIRKHLPAVFREFIWLIPLLLVGVFRFMDYPLLVEAFILAAFIPWLAGLFVFNRPFQRTPLDGPLLLLLMAAVLGLTVSYSFMLSAPAFLTLLGSLGVYYGVVNGTLTPRQGVQVVVGGATLVAAYFLARQFLPGPSFLLNLQANAVAGFVEMALLPALWLTWQARRPVRPVWVAAVVVIGLALLASGSRGAWLGLLLAGSLAGVLFTSGRMRQVVAIVLGMSGGLLAGLVVLALLMPTHRLPMLLYSSIEGVDTRLALYQNSLYLLAEYPLTGVGLGDVFAQVYSRYRLLIMPDYLYYPHNLWLSIWLGMGLIGLAALLWLIINLYRFVIQVETNGRGAVSERYLFRAVWLSSLVPLGHGFIDSPHFSNHLWVMPMLFAGWGLVISVGRLLERPPRRRSRPGRQTVWTAVAVGAGLLLVGWFARHSLLTVWHLNRGALSQTKVELSGQDNSIPAQARYHFDRILELDPENPAAHYRLGIMALDQDNVEVAITHLQTAYHRQPENESISKALALAYRANGQADRAEALFARLNPRSGITTGPNLWSY